MNFKRNYLYFLTGFLAIIGLGAGDTAITAFLSGLGLFGIYCVYSLHRDKITALQKTQVAQSTIVELKKLMDSGITTIDTSEIDAMAQKMEQSLKQNHELLVKSNKNLGSKRELKDENDQLKKEIERLNALVDPNAQKAEDAKQLLSSIEETITQKRSELHEVSEELTEKEKVVKLYDDDIQMIEFGLYKPVYDFANSELYKNRLDVVRQEQKNMIKNNTAAYYPENLTLSGSAKQGQAMVKDNVKQILRSFNNECDVLISKVKFNNIDAYRQRIIKSFEQLNKLNARLNIEITEQYLNSKLDELTLAYEYAQKKQEEKERAKEERERLREEAKLQKEIEEQRKALEKEQQQYLRALQTLETQLLTNPEDTDLLAKKAELEGNLDEVKKGIEDVDYREANKRAGYVYVISNIGSFGENIYKIGMTRRLEPMDRVNELGDASVPFNFDVHAMIFSNDAPALENALHHAFEDRRVNMINNRREFFNVTLEEIEQVVKDNFKERTVEFSHIPEAEQFRESEKMRAQ